jgi:hypothetical protein
MEYTIIKKILDAYIVEADRMEEFARVNCDEQTIKQIVHSLNLSQADYGDPYTSFIVIDENGNHITTYDLTHLDQE